MSKDTLWWDTTVHDTATNDTIDGLVATDTSNHLVTGFTSQEGAIPTTHMARVMAATGQLTGASIIPRHYTGTQRGIHYVSPPGTDSIVPVWTSNHVGNIFTIFATRYLADSSGLKEDASTVQISSGGGYNIHPRIIFCPRVATDALLMVSWVNVTSNVRTLRGVFVSPDTLLPESIEFVISDNIDSGYSANSGDLNTSLTHNITLTHYSNRVYVTYKENANELNIKEVSMPVSGRVDVAQYSKYGATGIGKFDVTLKNHATLPELMLVYAIPNQSQGVLLYANTIRLFTSTETLPAPVSLTPDAGVSQPVIHEAFKTKDGRKSDNPANIEAYEFVVAWNRTAGGVSYRTYNEYFQPIATQVDINRTDTGTISPRLATSDNQLAIYHQAGAKSGLRSAGVVLKVVPLVRK